MWISPYQPALIIVHAHAMYVHIQRPLKKNVVPSGKLTNHRDLLRMYLNVQGPRINDPNFPNKVHS